MYILSHNVADGIGLTVGRAQTLHNGGIHGYAFFINGHILVDQPIQRDKNPLAYAVFFIVDLLAVHHDIIIFARGQHQIQLGFPF